VSVKLSKFYKQVLTPEITTPEDYQRFISKLKTGKLIRKENPLSHSCAIALAFDAHTKRILVVHHKKAQSWIFPGGHIEPDELPTDSAIRELEEEIGLSQAETVLVGPFGAQVLDINNPPQICREHYDIFFGISTDPKTVSVNMKEFLGFEWLSIDDAKEKIKMEYYKDALNKFVKFMDW
jgi:8-oxo-dGTP diphosphatase